MSFWGTVGNALSTGASYLADGLGTVVDLGANALEYIPVVGETLSNGLGAIGDAGVEALQGNFGTALGDLYGGVDTLVGGVLPGGQAASQGYLSNPLSSLYNKADMAVGGYLPNIGGGVPAGGIGYSPTYVSAQKAFNALPGPGGSTYAGGGGMSGVALPSGGAAGAKTPGFWDKASAAANLAQTGMGIYSLMQGSPEASNAQAYQRATGTQPQRVAIQPGLGGAGAQSLAVPTNSVVAQDPAMGGTPEAKSTAGSTGGVPKTPELSKVSDEELTELQAKALAGNNHTQNTIGNVTGQRGPTAPAMTASSGVVGSPQLNMFMPTALGMVRSSNIPGGPRREYLSR